MKNIIIVEAISTGYNLVEDVRRRGYNPIVLESPGEASDDLKNMYKIPIACSTVSLK